MAQLNRLPQFARDLLASCPSAGAGVHSWLFRSARVLHPFYADKRELALLLEAASAGSGREIPEQEIIDAIRNSESCAWKPGERANTSGTKTSTWPTYERGLAEDIYEEVSASEYPRSTQLFDRDSLIIRSVIGWPDNFYSRTVLRRLHGGCDPIICAGVSTKFVGTGLLSEWDAGVKMPLPGQRRDSLLYLDDLQFVVPNAMRAEEGTAQSGKTSFRCRDNAAQHRRFVIVEFDRDGDEAMQPALLWHLRGLAPLVMCVGSGRRSIHGWFYVEPQTDEWQMKFFRYAVRLGADPRMWLPEQLARMPNGIRRDEDGTVIAKQLVIYFDPDCMSEKKEAPDGEVR